MADLYGHQLFRRCLICPPEIPSCPSCASDETCTLIATSCNQCASTVCTKVEGGQKSGNGRAGPIAGGVIGGVAVVAILTFLVWRYFIRDRRKAWDEHASTHDGVEKRDQFNLNREARQSTRSVHSIASTVLTRASNVIQIAYIPGVTNRSPPDTPGLLVPPVPPLPLATVNSSAASSPMYEQDQHFFLPGDIRDSTWSGYSDLSRASISPSLARASVATTIYRNNAIVSPVPAQQALRGKAAVVSVKSSGSVTPTSPESQTPPLPANAAQIANSSIVGRNLVPRPIQVKKTSSGSNVPTLANLRKAKANQETVRSPSKSETDESSSEEEVSKRRSTRPPRHSIGLSTIDDASAEALSSSARDRSSGTGHRHRKSGSLQNMIEEAMNRAAHGGGDHKKDGGPFSDDNEVRENQI